MSDSNTPGGPRRAPIQPSVDASRRIAASQPTASTDLPPPVSPRQRLVTPDRVAVPVRRGAPTHTLDVHDGGAYFGPWWLAKLPGRVWAVAVAATIPFRMVVWFLDAAVAAAMVGTIGVVYAWWTHYITDDQVAATLGQLGGRALGILSKSGIL